MKVCHIIKFRIWLKRDKRWLHGPNDRSDLDGINLLGETILLGGFCDGVKMESLNDLVCLQFTGAKDKYGKDIFDGDIIQCYIGILGLTKSGSPQIVKWDDKMLMWDIPRREDESLCDNSYEVIGNIYDNPDLIK